jgi:NADH:ubiquinone oxidoreductase subunit 2 (subunit N)
MILRLLCIWLVFNSLLLTYVYLRMVTEMELFESTNTKALRMVKYKDKLFIFNVVLILMYRSKDKYFLTQK